MGILLLVITVHRVLARHGLVAELQRPAAGVRAGASESVVADGLKGRGLRDGPVAVGAGRP